MDPDPAGDYEVTRLSRAPRPVRDLTTDVPYAELLVAEKAHYSSIEVTPELTEGGVHASACWRYYWERVGKILSTSECADFAGYLDRAFDHLERPLEILSLGSGYCGHEVALARRLNRPYRVQCTDVNERLFQEARQVARREGLAMAFGVADLNFMAIESQRYDVILANAVFHHVLNLEHLFDQVADGLAPGGIFHLVDVAGQNRKLIWDANERLANAILEAIPRDVTHGVRVDVPAEAEGMEGIRQAEIIPQLRRRFTPVFEHRHGSFMRFICTHPDLARHLDPGDERRRRYLDFLIDVDAAAVRGGVLEPLEIWGVYRPAPAGGRDPVPEASGGARE